MSIDDTTPQSSSGMTFTLILICAVVLSFAFMSWMNHSNETLSDPRGGLAPGQPAPELAADIWVRGEAPGPAKLEGEVYVVIAWATWCLPCYQEAPHLVEVHKQFKKEGVRFFGLTKAYAEDKEQIVAWLDARDVTWPNGFGTKAATTLEQYQADYIPGIWVIGRDGKVWWNRGMAERESLEEALRRTLDES
jgi:thiol-disulfide isomerase/thioredoxin